MNSLVDHNLNILKKAGQFHRFGKIAIIPMAGIPSPTFKANGNDIDMDAKDQNGVCDDEKSSEIRKIVSFHPSLVTAVNVRPPTSTEEKHDLYFSWQELQWYRREEKAQSVSNNKLTSIIKSQEKNTSGKQYQKGTVKRVSFGLSA